MALSHTITYRAGVSKVFSQEDQKCLFESVFRKVPNPLSGEALYHSIVILISYPFFEYYERSKSDYRHNIALSFSLAALGVRVNMT